MKMKIWKRMASFALALVMVLGLAANIMPTAYAANDMTVPMGDGFYLTIKDGQVTHTLRGNTAEHNVTDITIDINGYSSSAAAYLLRWWYSFGCDHVEGGHTYKYDTQLHLGTDDIPPFSCDQDYTYKATESEYTGEVTYSYTVYREATAHQCTETTTPANCETPQITTYSKCTRCNKTPAPVTTGSTDPNNHSKLSNWTSNGDGTHTRSCSGCGFSESGNCSYSAATCVTPATCTLCGGSYYGEHVYGAAQWYENNLVHYHPCTQGGCDAKCEQTASADGSVITLDCGLEDCGICITIALPEISGAYTYNGSEITPWDDENVVYADKSGQTLNVIPEKRLVSVQYQNNIDAGPATAFITYGGVTATRTFSIDKATPAVEHFNITLPQNEVYDGMEKVATVALKDGYTGAGEITVTYYKNGTKLDGAPTGAGTYTAEFTVAGGSNFEPGKLPAGEFTIAKADYDMSSAMWDYNGAFAYDGKGKTVEVIGLPYGVTADYEGNIASAVGDYVAKAVFSYDGENYNAPVMADLNWSIVNDWEPTEYIVSTPNENGWLNDAFTITPAEGYVISTTNTDGGTWENQLTDTAEADNGSVTFYLRNMADDTISLGKTVSYKIDKTPPTGTVTISTKSWAEFLNNVTFGLFFNKTQEVSVAAADNLSGVDKIEYVESRTPMDLDAVKAAAQWTEMKNGSVSVALEDTKQFVYYIRITDMAGNVTYLSSDGAVYDTTAPVISGVEDGKTCYTTQKVSITDQNLDTVTVNGTSVLNASAIILPGNTEAEFVISATDKAGNTTTVTVTMMPIRALAEATGDLTNDNVTSADAPALGALVEKLDELLADDDATDGERENLEQHKDIAESLIRVIEDIAAEQKSVADKAAEFDEDAVKSTDKAELEELAEEIEALLAGDHLTDAQRDALEDVKAETEALMKTIEEAAKALDTEKTEKVEDVTAENVKPADKTDLKDAKADLEKALEENKANYTEAEKKAVAAEITRIDEALEAIENVETVVTALDKLPATADPDDEAAIKTYTDAKAAYDALTAYEKTLISKDTLAKLAALAVELTDYEIIKGDKGEWSNGSGGLTLTANGAFSKFTGIEVDGKAVDPKHYEVKSGSTIITFKPDYLKTLSSGKHTITVNYTDGETEGTFTVKAADGNATVPGTGDHSGILLYSVLLTVSIAAMAVLMLAVKKRKQA